MTFVNLTPHEVVVECKNGDKKVFPPSGEVARVELEDICVAYLDGMPVHKGKVKEVTGIPKPQPGVVYIVSLFVLQHCKDRHDLVAPDTNGAIRDDEGRIVAVKGWRK